MWRIIIIGLVLLFLFGGKRFGEIGKGLGEGIRNFKKALGDKPTPPAPRSAPDVHVLTEVPLQPPEKGASRVDKDDETG